jgi:hypothetical protein
MTMDRQQIRERLEACRPGSDDRNAPEMGEAVRALAEDARLRTTFDWIERQDQRLVERMPQVEVPSGLQDRLLARLAEAAAASEKTPAPAGQSPQGQSPQGQSPQGQSPQGQSPQGEERGAERLAAERRTRVTTVHRRWWMGIVATAAALLVMAGWVYFRPPAPTVERLAMLSLEWTETMSDRESDWQAFRESEFPGLPWRPLRWQPISAHLDAEVVAFDFGESRGRKLVLYQIRTRHSLPLPRIPYESLSVTGAWLSGAWQEGDHVYIAVTTDARLLDGLRRAYLPT